MCGNNIKKHVIEKHPEHKTKFSQLQSEIRSLENKAQQEENHLKSFTFAPERSKYTLFFVMKPRLRTQTK